MPKNNKNILVIDDDQVIQDLISYHLGKENYKVYQAPNSAAGFQSLSQHKIDLVLCDIMMDGMDGFDFCKKVRENEKYRPLPFIFITAKTSLSDKVKALESGGDDLITKPFDVSELILKIQTLIKRSDIYKAYSVKDELAYSFADDEARILLVDDDPSVTKIIGYGLKKAGYDCVTASSALEGYNLAGQFKPDLIISDILMPEIDGYMFRKMLEENSELKDTPFVFLTAKEGEEDILDGFDRKVNDYIVKTSGAKIITAKVKAIINGLAAERKKVVKEINTAADFLRVKVVADSIPDFNEYDIKQWHLPYQGIPGGDFLAYIKLSESTLAIVLGDVMGKKWGAWYFAFAYAAYIRSNLRSVIQNEKEPSPGQILKLVNNHVYDDATVSEIFASVSILIINNEENIIKYSGAGDIPLFLKSNDTIKKIYADGVFLGLTPEGAYSDRELKVEPGDALFLLTDGILETRNAAGEQYGNRLQKLLKHISSNENCLEKIKEDFLQFASGKSEDDISIISIFRKF